MHWFKKIGPHLAGCDENSGSVSIFPTEPCLDWNADLNNPNESNYNWQAEFEPMKM